MDLGGNLGGVGGILGASREILGGSFGGSWRNLARFWNDLGGGLGETWGGAWLPIKSFKVDLGVGDPWGMFGGLWGNLWGPGGRILG